MLYFHENGSLKFVVALGSFLRLALESVHVSLHVSVIRLVIRSAVGSAFRSAVRSLRSPFLSAHTCPK